MIDTAFIVLGVLIIIPAGIGLWVCALLLCMEAWRKIFSVERE
jgi:hypothetical protein